MQGNQYSRLTQPYMYTLSSGVTIFVHVQEKNLHLFGLRESRSHLQGLTVNILLCREQSNVLRA